MPKEQFESITAAQIMRKAATIRNTQVAASGRTPMELAFGRRPRDILDPTTMNPEQLTVDKTKGDITNDELQKMR